MPRMIRVALAGIWIAAATLAVGDETLAPDDVVQLAPLHVIPTESKSGKPIPAGSSVRLRLSSPNPQGLAKALGIELSSSQTSFEYVLDKYPLLSSSTQRTWLEPTFVIDFNEPEFEPLRKELDARGATISRPQLVEYVAGLVEASNERSWDLASVVARRRKGDCSEYAVLTAALARLEGIPARVVVGVVLVSNANEHSAFGHAWAEMLEDGKWTVADAALFELKGVQARYLPLGMLEDEGMGYGMDLIRHTQIWIDRVEVLGPR